MYTLKNLPLVVFFLFVFNILPAQKRGLNYDPDPQGRGERPYEMAGRQEERKPVITFEDVTRWTVEAKGCEAGLYRSNDQLLYRDYSGKLIYKKTAAVSEITVRPVEEIKLEEAWDCINFWNHGAHWLWGEPDFRRALQHFALIRDGDGKVHEINFVQSGYKGLVHQYWFLNHIKLPANLKRPLTFEGIRFRGRNVTDDAPLNIYLGPLYMYEEELKPMSFDEFPALPFPVREVTILPSNKTEKFENKTEEQNGSVDFVYEGDDAVIRYRVSLKEGFPLGVSLVRDNENISIFHGGGLVFDTEGEPEWSIDSQIIKEDTLRVEATANVGGATHAFSFYYTINQKSLIIGMDEPDSTGHVKKVALGSTGPVHEGKLISVPFLNFDYAVAPRILYAGGMFYFVQFDWYYTDASQFYMEMPEIKEGMAVHNGGARYIPKTDGIRNPLHERLFVNVSPDVQEVFPTIDNPPSPMRPSQANRLWRINGNPDHDELKAEADRLRSLGIEHLTIRYHEGIWRDGGESYTFRLETAPKRGGHVAVKELVSYIKSKGWRVGLYTNYTDLAPVNKNWSEDMMMRGPKGEWKVSWSRCYAPKPMKAMEFERIYAPLIHEMFGSNHSYCDVHTAVSPMSRVDYDHRVPGAATFRRTFECFGQILLHEKKAYWGPVYSEGANHWWYAGLVDGNYANARPALNKRPVFPDFQLLKINPLEIDAGNVSAKGREYLAYTLAYGHIGICDGDEAEMMKRYYMLQPLQEYYSMVPVEEIAYESGGIFYNTSGAIAKGLNEQARLKLRYASGLEVYVNFDENPWKLSVGGRQLTLPEHGFMAVSDDEEVIAMAGMDDGMIMKTGASADVMQSPAVHYFDTKGDWMMSETLSGKGSVAMKKEPFGWEIIPAREFEEFGFTPEITGLGGQNLRIEAVREDGLPGGRVLTRWSRGKLYIMEESDNALKYRVVPATGRAQMALDCAKKLLKGGDEVDIMVPTGWEARVKEMSWETGDTMKNARFIMATNMLMVHAPAKVTAGERYWLRVVMKNGDIYWLDFIGGE